MSGTPRRDFEIMVRAMQLGIVEQHPLFEVCQGRRWLAQME